MNIFLVSAGILSVLVGLIHSVLGELLIFSKLRAGGLVPSIAPQPLQERNLRILWATWHITSVFGWMVGVILIKLANSVVGNAEMLIQSIAFAMFFSALLVLFATKAKHPGWLGLGGVAVLCWFA